MTAVAAAADFIQCRRLVIQDSLYCLCSFTGSAAFLRMRTLSISTGTEMANAK